MDAFRIWQEWLGLTDDFLLRDYYSFLGLPAKEDNTAEIQRTCDACIARVRNIRPGSHAAQWTALLDTLQHIKTTLTDPEKKKQYDRILAHQPSRASVGEFLRRTVAPRQQRNQGETMGQDVAATAAASHSDQAVMVASGVTESMAMAMAPFIPDFTTADSAADPRAPMPWLEGHVRGGNAASPLAKCPSEVVMTNSPIVPGAMRGTSAANVTGSVRQESAGAPIQPTASPKFPQRPRTRRLSSGSHASSFVSGVICGVVLTFLGFWVSKGWWQVPGRMTTVAVTDATDNSTGPSQNAFQGNLASKSPQTAVAPGPLRTGTSSQPPQTTSVDVALAPPVSTTDYTRVPNLPPSEDTEGSQPAPRPSNGTTEGSTLPEPKMQEPGGTTPTRPNGNGAGTQPQKPSVPLTLEERQQLVAGFEAARTALLEQRAAEALQQLEKTRPLVRSEEHQMLYSRLERLALYLEEYREGIRRALEKLSAGDSVEISETSSVGIVERKPTALTVRVSGQNVTYPLDQLPLRLGLALLKHGMPDDAHAMAVRAAFQATHPRANDAQRQEAFQWWTQAAQQGEMCEGLESIFTENYPAILGQDDSSG